MANVSIAVSQYGERIIFLRRLKDGGSSRSYGIQCARLAGMPRRYVDYPDAFSGWNMISSLGAYLSFLSAILFVFIVFRTLTAGSKCAENPWGEGATTLEWTTSSPPPFHTFEELPEVK